MHKIGVLGVGLLAVLAGCGDSDSRDDAKRDKAVIATWAEAVREGDYAAANATFALPATVFNGREVVLETRAQVDRFNRGFPCGAVLEATQEEPGGTTLATFELVKAGGGRTCPGAVGARAKVSFEIDAGGHITTWYRVSTEPPPGAQES